MPDFFALWIENARPEVVVTTHFPAGGWLKQLGLVVPADIGLTHLNIGPAEHGWSGVDQRNDLIGATAVDMLSAHLQCNERGIPAYPKTDHNPGMLNWRQNHPDG